MDTEIRLYIYIINNGKINLTLIKKIAKVIEAQNNEHADWQHTNNSEITKTIMHQA